jgi:hypothetical protein
VVAVGEDVNVVIFDASEVQLVKKGERVLEVDIVIRDLFLVSFVLAYEDCMHGEGNPVAKAKERVERKEAGHIHRA